jgi:hypothetical protein
MGDGLFALDQAGTNFHLQPAALADLHTTAAGLAVLDRERGPAFALAEQRAGGRWSLSQSTTVGVLAIGVRTRNGYCLGCDMDTLWAIMTIEVIAEFKKIAGFFSKLRIKKRQ